MKKPVFIIVTLLFTLLLGACSPDKEVSVTPPVVGDPLEELYACKRPLLVAEQSRSMAAIYNAETNKPLWTWLAADAIPEDKQGYFANIDEVKPVFNRRYIMITASSGGVALVRVADKKLMFWATPGRNPHSIEALPDGYLVMAASGSTNAVGKLLFFRPDSLDPYTPLYVSGPDLLSAHGVVWDRERELLYAVGDNKLNIYEYTNDDGRSPRLALQKTLAIPGAGAHDFYPVHGEDALWLTNSTTVFKFHPASERFETMSFSQGAVKSVSSGDPDMDIAMLKATESYWSDAVINSAGQKILSIADGRIYKARWFLENRFGYPEFHDYIQPGD